MRKFTSLLIVITLLLCSCRPLEKDDDLTASANTTVFEDTTVKIEESLSSKADTTESAPSLPMLIGFYDDLENNGSYTRLSEWKEPWVAGRDIAVFDIIPSSEALLYSKSYKKLWTDEAAKLPEGISPKPYFILRYTLSDNTQKEVEIKSYIDAEDVNAEGYLEVYLYDDIHQEDGAWYYHLTETTTDENTVISSFKLTAGKEISSVTAISLIVLMEGSSEATVNIYNG